MNIGEAITLALRLSSASLNILMAVQKSQQQTAVEIDTELDNSLKDLKTLIEEKKLV